jgi:hypothetical protein
MALETQYVVENHAEANFPVIYRCILVDGVEVSRAEDARFAEIKAAYPAIIDEYFTAVATWAHDFANYMDQQSEFTAGNFLAVQRASRFFYDFMDKFNYAEIANSEELPHLQAPEPVAEEPVAEEPAPAEETPVTE